MVYMMPLMILLLKIMMIFPNDEILEDMIANDADGEAKLNYLVTLVF